MILLKQWQDKYIVDNALAIAMHAMRTTIEIWNSSGSLAFA